MVPGVKIGSDLVGPAKGLRGHSPQILLCLYRQMYAFSLGNGIRYWYAAMERSLVRVLTRMSFSFRQIGPQTDYYGPVAPYLADLRELEVRLGQSNPALLAWMQSAP
jgi:N-acyl amino acid synthase of PEP-CTERM/exosortase system